MKYMNFIRISIKQIGNYKKFKKHKKNVLMYLISLI